MTTLASQTTLPNGIQPENYAIATEQPPGSQTDNDPVLFLSCCNSCPTDIQELEEHTKTTPTGDTSILPLMITTPLSEERLVRDEQANELYLPLTSLVVLERKQEWLYLPLGFENNLTIYALVDSGAYLSAFAQIDLDAIKQKAPKNFLQIDNPPNFQIQVANGQLEKPLATATLKFEI